MANEFKFEKKSKQPLPMSVHRAIRHDLYLISMTYMLGAVIFSTVVPAVMSVCLDDKISVVMIQHWLIGTGITMAMLIPIILICWLVDYQIYKNS